MCSPPIFFSFSPPPSLSGPSILFLLPRRTLSSPHCSLRAPLPVSPSELLSPGLLPSPPSHPHLRPPSPPPPRQCGLRMRGGARRVTAGGHGRGGACGYGGRHAAGWRGFPIRATSPPSDVGPCLGAGLLRTGGPPRRAAVRPRPATPTVVPLFRHRSPPR